MTRSAEHGAKAASLSSETVVVMAHTVSSPQCAVSESVKSIGIGIGTNTDRRHTFYIVSSAPYYAKRKAHLVQRSYDLYNEK